MYYISGTIFALQKEPEQKKTKLNTHMKTLSIINLHKAELRKSQLASIKGGIEVRCFCTVSNPLVTTRESGGSSHVCICEGSTAEAGVFNSSKSD